MKKFEFLIKHLHFKVMLSGGHCAYSVLIVSVRLENQSDCFSLALHKKKPRKLTEAAYNGRSYMDFSKHIVVLKHRFN